MRIPQYNEQFRYQNRQKGGTIRGGDYAGVAKANAVAADNFNRGLGAFAKGVSDANAVATKMKIDRDKAKAQEALTAYQSAFDEWQTGAMEQKGENGIEAAKGYDDWQKSAIGKATEGLSEDQKHYFNQTAAGAASSHKAWADRWGIAQAEQANQSAYTARIDGLQNSFSQGVLNVEQSKELAKQIKDESFSRAKQQGLGDEATFALYRENMGGAVKDAVANLIADGKIKQARSVMSDPDYKNFMDASERNTLMKQVEVREAAIAKANEKAAKARQKEAELSLVAKQVASAYDLVKDAPIDEQEGIGLAHLMNAEFANEELRDKAITAFSKQMTRVKKVHEGETARQIHNFNKQLAENSDASLYEVQAQIQQAKTDGTINADAADKIITDLGKKQKVETTENRAALADGLAMIDRTIANGESVDMDSIYTLAQKYNLTPSQTDKLVKYAEDGGVRSGQKYSTWNTAYKNMTGKNLEKLPYAVFESFVDALPAGKSVEEPEIRRALSPVIVRENGAYNNRGGSVHPDQDESSWFTSNSQSYEQAVKSDAVDVWLPELSDEEEADVLAEMQDWNKENPDEQVLINDTNMSIRWKMNNGIEHDYTKAPWVKKD